LIPGGRAEVHGVSRKNMKTSLLWKRGEISDYFPASELNADLQK
jgi:hypothetical protein